MNIEDVRSQYEIMMRNQPDFVIDLILDKNKDYKSRIDKAIDYIDRRDIEWGSDEHDNLLNMLKGEDNE